MRNPGASFYRESMIPTLLSARRTRLLPLVAALVGVIAAADWAVGNRMSLGVLYVLPMMVGGAALGQLQIVALALVCSSLRSTFDLPSPPIEMLLRFVFALIAYSVSGLMVAGLIRNRHAALEHLERIRREQELRREAEEQLRTLAESSPAAIFTVGGDGVVLAANNAANQIFGLSGNDSLRGQNIARYLPVLGDALQVGIAIAGLRTSAQSQAYRADGEIFLAHTWFSSYRAGEHKRLAAIVVDTSEEMREHEEESLRQAIQGNHIAAAAISHEVRNLCSAISVVSAGLREKQGLAEDDEFQALESLVRGLEAVSSLDLQARTRRHETEEENEEPEEISLQSVLDDLRIVIEPEWREIEGAVQWNNTAPLPSVLADRHGLLQVFLNLAKNSHRAVRTCAVRELRVTVEADERKALVRFRDTGSGIASPGRLFEPFQPGADGSGLGLYVSRAVVRGYGGDLRFEPQAGGGSCFAVELQVVPSDGGSYGD